MSKLVSEVVALFVTSILLLLDQGTYCSKFSCHIIIILLHGSSFIKHVARRQDSVCGDH